MTALDIINKYKDIYELEILSFFSNKKKRCVVYCFDKITKKYKKCFEIFKRDEENPWEPLALCEGEHISIITE